MIADLMLVWSQDVQPAALRLLYVVGTLYTVHAELLEIHMRTRIASFRVKGAGNIQSASRDLCMVIDLPSPCRTFVQNLMAVALSVPLYHRNGLGNFQPGKDRELQAS